MARALMLAAAIGLLLPTQALAQDPAKKSVDSPPSQPPAPAKEATPVAPDESEKAPPTEDTKTRYLEAIGHEGMVNRRIAQLLRLRAEMFDKLDLSQEKRKKIDEMLDDYFVGIANPAHKPASKAARAASMKGPTRLWAPVDLSLARVAS